MNKKVAMLTMGHSPRTDILPDIRARLNDNIEIIHEGVLDEFSCEFICNEMVPNNDGEPFISRLNDGNMHALSRKKTMDILQEKVNKYTKNGINAIVLLCTSKFDPIVCSVPLIEPYKLLHNTVKSINAGMRTSAVFPFESHVQSMIKNWEEDISLLYSICINPSDSIGDKKIIEYFSSYKTDLLILDCIGYTNEWYIMISNKLGIPVLHPRTLITGLLNNIF